MLMELLQTQAKGEYPVACLLIYGNQFQEIAYQIAGKLADNGVEIHFVKYATLNNILGLAYHINKELKQIKPDIIHTHLRLAEFCLTVLKSVNLKTPVVNTVHGYRDLFKNKFVTASMSIRTMSVRQYLVKFIFRGLDGCIFISDFLLNFYLANKLVRGTEKTYRIDNACLAADINKPDDAKIDKNNVRLILSGRLIEMKGHIFAFEAIKMLSAKYPSISLDCYGLGPYFDALQRKAAELKIAGRVKFKGFTDNIVEKISEYDIALVPSMFESFGIVFLDSFTAKVPVVAFDIPAGNEIITDGYNGLLAEPKNSASLAAKIEMLIEDPELKNRIVVNAQKVLKEKYSMDLMVTKYLKVYQDVLG